MVDDESKRTDSRENQTPRIRDLKPVSSCLVTRKKQYWPDHAIPADFQKWVKAQGYGRHPGTQKAAFAEWIYKKANLKDPKKLQWSEVKEKARRAAKEMKWLERKETEENSAHYSLGSKTTPYIEEVAEGNHFWNRLQICRCTILIGRDSPFYPQSRFTTIGYADHETTLKWSKDLYASAQSESYFTKAIAEFATEKK